MKKIILILLTIIISLSCNKDDKESIKDISIKEIPSPSDLGAEPNLFRSADGQIFLSWVQTKNDTTDQLYFSQLVSSKWASPKLIAEGNDWFVNWADFPSIAVSNNKENIAAHWLQKRAEGTYDYDVRIAQSKDLGQKWSPSFIPHTDNIAAEHGFVTMLPLGNGRTFATWLDGRNTKTEDAHAHSGAMTLRTAEFDAEGKLFEEAELDTRVCDCCQTDAAISSEGLLVVYRDRSETEIRDISIVRKVNGKWTDPKPIFKDDWQINGCPVNGPAIAAEGSSVAVAWFSMKEDRGNVKLAFSKDAGARFAEPIQLDEGDPLGRVDVVFTKQGDALVTWIEQQDESGMIKLARVNQEGSIIEKINIGEIDDSRRSGFPILEKGKDQYVMAWTQVDSLLSLKTVSFDLSMTQ